MPVTAGFLEPMCESIPLGIYASWSAYHLFGINPYLWFAGHWLIWFLLDYIQLRGIQVTSLFIFLFINFINLEYRYTTHCEVLPEPFAVFWFYILQLETSQSCNTMDMGVII